jgi:hypothetical protein
MYIDIGYRSSAIARAVGGARSSQRCKICCGYHRGSAPKQDHLQPMIMGGVAERWAIDLTGPHPVSNGYSN